MASLFAPYQMGNITLGNRFVMAPMTRARRPDYVANEETALYYRQRATAGLIVSEGTTISPEAQGNIDVPGIWTEEQIAGWRKVTEAVHQEGGKIFAQLWHVGRVSHTSLQPDGKAPVSASDIPATGKGKPYVHREDGRAGFADASTPRPLATDEVARVVKDYAHAAHNAIKAGFDGVELHSANGYLLEQFLNPKINTRTDQYGGSLENRARFTLEVVDALIEAIGKARVGIRLSPFNQQFDMPPYAENADTYLYLAQELTKREVVYVHLNDNWAAGHSVISDDFVGKFRALYPGTLMLAGAQTLERAQRQVDEGLIDLPAFGQPFIANPDLVERFRQGAELNTPDRDTYYGGGTRGYTDYPTLS
ncbi:alkene reductase [Carnimonas nigrificans]|uniref:alkene reductase n=1 Tax=Carnimonas nigrificans TaxID=64323 RepID=UPI00046F1829|nr:alkene reductase [Carnimonas nigrificans]